MSDFIVEVCWRDANGRQTPWRQFNCGDRGDRKAIARFRKLGQSDSRTFVIRNSTAHVADLIATQAIFT